MSYVKIGTVARLLLMSERRIREYERVGLIHPVREPHTGDRLFSERDIEQLRRLRTLVRERGLTLNGLRELLRYAPCWELTGCGQACTCPAARNPQTPCYRLRAEGAEMPLPLAGSCKQCCLCGVKDTPRAALVCPPWRDSGSQV